MNNSERRRLLVIGLDGLEISYATTLMDVGEMPALAALRDRSASYLLDHGPAQRTGLAWEHAGSGLSPADANRWSAVEFDPKSYEAWQEGGRFRSYLDSLDGKIVIFDNPYLDLKKSPNLQGVVAWGAHDAGTTLQFRPPGNAAIFKEKFGRYPSSKWTYACPGYSIDQCREMGDALVEGLRVRQEASLWMINDAYSDADVFYFVPGELHSACEGLWHGVDPSNVMHGHPSAPAAAEALLKIHRAIDRFVGELVTAVGEARVIVFAMGGMGSNHSDLQTMVLLPELLYRHEFGKPLIQVPAEWSADPKGVPELDAGADWGILKQYYPNQETSALLLPEWVRGVSRKIAHKILPARLTAPGQRHNRITWQPTTFYGEFWPEMRAFAIPSFYDGRIRINLEGREVNGKVSLEDYESVCSEIADLLAACRDPRTGEPVVADIERSQAAHPYDLVDSDVDMVVVWNGAPNAFEHPAHGLIGPVPYRRTGGHTGPRGMAYFAGTPLPAGFQGTVSSFNIAPTIAELVNGRIPGPKEISGESLLAPFGVPAETVQP